MKHLKMRSKLIGLFAITGLIPMIVISLLLLTNATKQIESDVMDKTQFYFHLVEDRIADYYAQREGDGRILASVGDVSKGLLLLQEYSSGSAEWKEQYQLIEHFTKVSVDENDFLDIFLTDTSGNIVLSTEFKDDLENANVSHRTYLQTSLSGNQNWSPLFFSDFIYNNTIVLSTPVQHPNNKQRVIGTINIMIYQQRLDEIVHRGITDLGDSADGYLVNKEGVLQTNTMLGDYRDYSANSRTVESQAVNRALLELQNGNGDYIYQSIHDNYFDTRVLGSSGIVRMGGEEVALLIEVSEEEAFGHVRRVINVSLFIILISILAGLVTAIIISTMISKPLLVATRHAQQLSMFDLSKNLPNKYTTQRDEAGELASAIQTTINNIRKLMKEISNSSEMVAAMSEELTASSQQSSTVAEEVSKTIDEIAVGASDQAVSTQLGAEQASKLGGKIVENQQYLDSLNTASVKVSQVVSDGLSGVERLTIISKESTDVTKEVFEGIQNTNESANKIGAASHVIAAIADQTNLLALNAAIEAARAGEAGKGFAVVADEIRKLAEQSTMNTKAIDTVVSELQKNATDAVRRVERLVTISNEQQESIFNSKAQYLTISEAMAAAINAVEKLNVSGEEMGHLKDQIIESLQTLSAIAEQNSASTQEVSAAMEEQSASMEEIASSSEDLANLAGNLRSIINRFIV